MPHHPTATNAPYEMDVGRAGWIHDANGNPVPIVARSRRRITVDAFGTRLVLKRRHLETLGYATANNGAQFFVSRYQPPDWAA